MSRCFDRQRQGLRTRAWVEENRRTVERAVETASLRMSNVPQHGRAATRPSIATTFPSSRSRASIIDGASNGGGSAPLHHHDVLQRSFDGTSQCAATACRSPSPSPASGGRRLIINVRPDSVRRPRCRTCSRYRTSARSSGSARGRAPCTPPTRRSSSTAARDRAARGFFTRDGKWALKTKAWDRTSTSRTGRRTSSPGRDPQLERAVQEAMLC